MHPSHSGHTPTQWPHLQGLTDPELGILWLTCQVTGREGGVAIGTPHLAVGVLVPVALTADIEISPRTKDGAIAVRKENIKHIRKPVTTNRRLEARLH